MHLRHRIAPKGVYLAAAGLMLLFAGPVVGQEDQSAVSDEFQRLRDEAIQGFGETPVGTPADLPILPTTEPADLPLGSSLPVFSEEKAQALEADILRYAVTITDPLQRSQALERLARSRIRQQRLDDAMKLMSQAANSAKEAKPGLGRDLRLIGAIRVLMDLAYAQVIDALSASSFDQPALGATELPEALEGDRMGQLSRARESWRIAYRLAESIENINYRCEQTFKIATGQSIGSQLISRSGLRGSVIALVPDVARTDLLNVADQLLVDAANESNAIKRTIWRDWASVNVAVNSAEAAQYCAGPEHRTGDPGSAAAGRGFDPVRGSLAGVQLTRRGELSHALERSAVAVPGESDVGANAA